MTYDPTTETAKSHGIAAPGMGVIDVVPDEKRGIVYVVLIDAKKPWMLYDLKTTQFRPLGPIPTVFGTTLIDNRGHANVITKDFQLAQFNPDNGEVKIRDIVVDGKKLHLDQLRLGHPPGTLHRMAERPTSSSYWIQHSTQLIFSVTVRWSMRSTMDP